MITTIFIIPSIWSDVHIVWGAYDWRINNSVSLISNTVKKNDIKKVNEIFLEMEEKWTLGTFFPASMNPYYFNDTAASLVEDFTKEEVIGDGYLRRDEEIAVDIPEWMDVVEVKDLGEFEWWKNETWKTMRHAEFSSASPWIPRDTGSESGMTNTSWWIDPSILKKVIKDEEGNVYRVIKMEYDFLMKYGLPLPRKHRFAAYIKGHFRVK